MSDDAGMIALLVLGLAGTAVTLLLSIVAMGRGRRALSDSQQLRADVDRLASTMTQLRGILVELRPLAERAKELPAASVAPEPTVAAAAPELAAVPAPEPAVVRVAAPVARATEPTVTPSPTTEPVAAPALAEPVAASMPAEPIAPSTPAEPVAASTPAEPPRPSPSPDGARKAEPPRPSPSPDGARKAEPPRPSPSPDGARKAEPVAEPAPAASPTAGSAAAAPGAAPEGAAVPADVIAARVAQASGGSPPPPKAAAAPRSTGTLEEKIALVWFTRIGAVALLLGVAYFFKYAVDNDWIGPGGRVAGGVLLGIVTLAIGEVTRRRSLPVWTQVVSGAGLAILFLSAFASYSFYHLVPPEGAFAAFFVIAVLGGALSMRHNAEAILIVALAGALAAPPLLSTGEDRPGALFGYILFITTLADVVAVRMQFRWALWVGIAGAFMLYVGWYATFFDVTPPATADDPEWIRQHHTTGAYYMLRSRAIPLAAITGFLAQWLGLYWAARTRPRLWPLAILLAAAVLAHFGYTSLLHDQPVQLAVLLVILALVSLAALTREGKSQFLALPLFSSFLMLAGTAHNAAERHPLPMLFTITAWAGIYAFGVVRGQTSTEKRQLTAGTQALLGSVGLAFAILAALVLKHHPSTFELVMVGLSCGYAGMTLFLDTPVVATVAVWVSFLFFAAHMPKHETHTDLLFIGISALWASVYGGAMAWEMVIKRRPATALRVLTFSTAGMLFVLLAMAHIHDDDDTLRGLVLGAVGLVDFAVGALVLRHADAKTRRAATAILGQALALFAGAAGALWTGATITIVWAALAALVVWLASESRDPYWLAGGLTLFFAVVIRVLAYDWPYTEHQFDLFMGTAGKEGQLSAPFLLGQRSLGLLSMGVAMLVGGRAARRPHKESRGFPPAGIVLVTIAHIGLVALVVSEVHLRAPTLPHAPGTHDPAEFRQFVTDYATALAAAQQKLAMLTTLVFALYASCLLGWGFNRKDALYRYLGLSLFAITLCKLGFYDVWQLQRIYQVLVLVAVGALLLSSGFLYARFGKRLVAAFRDNSGKAALLVAGVGLLFGAHAHAGDVPWVARLASERVVEGVQGPGFYRVEVDAALYHASKARLSDIRLRGPDGAEVPYLVRRVPVPTPARVLSATVVDRVRRPNGAVSAVVDLGKSPPRHSRVQVDLDAGEYFRRTRVEVSSDEKKWGVIAEGEWIYRVGGSERSTLSYPASDQRYLRVTVLPGPEAVRAITGASLSFAPPSSQPLVRSQPLKLVRSERRDLAKDSVYTFDAGEPGIPLTGLTLQIAPGRAFERRASVASATTDAYYVGSGGAWIWRAANQSGTGWTTLDPGGTTKRFLQATIHDGDDAPLAVTGASVEWLAEEVVFRVETPGGYRLFVGGTDVGAPHYDIADVLQRAGEVQLLQASLGALHANPDYGKLPPPPPPPFTERYRTVIAIAGGAVLAVFAFWAVMLLRRAKPESDSGT